MKKVFLLFYFVFFSTQAIAADFQSGPKQVALLELYSSEGCSSCPPAEKWVNRLKQDPGLWKEFVPVVFHVDYWDYIGWKDPHASPLYSQRQRQYAQSWRANSVYTPGMVFNGREYLKWRTNRDLPDTELTIGELFVNKLSSCEFKISFKPINQIKNSYRVLGTLLGCDLTSNVIRGENRGRELHHEFIVLTLAQTDMVLSSDGTYEAIINLKNSSHINPKQSAVAFWITLKNELQPIQAIGGYL